MSDIDRDPELDRKRPDSSPEQQVPTGADAETPEPGDGRAPTSPLEPTGIDDGVAGTAGTVKNQDRTAQ